MFNKQGIGFFLIIHVTSRIVEILPVSIPRCIAILKNPGTYLKLLMLSELTLNSTFSRRLQVKCTVATFCKIVYDIRWTCAHRPWTSCDCKGKKSHVYPHNNTHTHTHTHTHTSL